MSIKDVLLRYATPLTTWLFLISLVSGVALFFGARSQYFREMHEILSMFLIVPFVLHVWRNWRTLMSYFRHSAMWVSMVVCLVATGAIVHEGAGASSGGNPRTVVFGALNSASVTALAALGRTDEATVTERLKTIGVEVRSAEDTVAGLAKLSGRDSFDVLYAALTSTSATSQPVP